MSQTATKERPILFSAPMVRAIIAGRKTQTRRIVKIHSKNLVYDLAGEHGLVFADGAPRDQYLHVPFRHKDDPWDGCVERIYPRWDIGDRLWVRETFSAWFSGCHWHDSKRQFRCKRYCSNLFYRCTHHMPDDDQRWVPSIFMPRWASRITLEVTGVRVERLHEITKEDAEAEGIEQVDQCGIFRCSGWRDYSNNWGGFINPVRSFRSLWDLVNGAESWNANPWVWVIDFRRIEP